VAFAEPGLVTANLERLGGTAESPVAGRRALAPGDTARGHRLAGFPMHAIFRGLATSRSGAAEDIDTHYVFGSADPVDYEYDMFLSRRWQLEAEKAGGGPNGVRWAESDAGKASRAREG
jgi:hypothetical protein